MVGHHSRKVNLRDADTRDNHTNYLPLMLAAKVAVVVLV